MGEMDRERTGRGKGDRERDKGERVKKGEGVKKGEEESDVSYSII